MNEQMKQIRAEAVEKGVEQEFLHQFYVIMSASAKHGTKTELIPEHAQGALEIALRKRGYDVEVS
ncbi:hypothetical protein GCM10007063_05970 [Lentibacillus kapialis]|uniref:Uncharacterized protein n=1 Tax=Lentibacillus kapialis TaxID=340214 RepID=A0A917PNY2_9BACI|nr:hypothetical protein [Lentibacillus kapialis]GGJ86279.1 hypothetical protein GCM10007063_05970 [Lentibacillus kapialis]